MERDCCKFICGAPTIFQNYEIEQKSNSVFILLLMSVVLLCGYSLLGGLHLFSKMYCSVFLFFFVCFFFCFFLFFLFVCFLCPA